VTALTIVWRGTGDWLIVKLVLTTMRKKIKNNAQKELIKFKELVEKYGVKFTHRPTDIHQISHRPFVKTGLEV